MVKRIRNKKLSALEKYKKEVHEKLAVLQPLFANASVGDFSKDVKIPKTNDEFAQLYTGIQIMIEIVREKLSMMEEVNHSLEKKIKALKLEVDDEIFVGVKGVLIKINTREIIYVKSVSDYVIIHTAKKKYIAHSTMKGLFNKLSENEFMRVHHSFIVRLDKILEKHKDEIIIGDVKIPVSRVNRKKLAQKLKSL